MAALTVVAVGHQTLGKAGTLDPNTIILSVARSVEGTAVTDLNADVGTSQDFQLITTAVPLGGSAVSLRGISKVQKGAFYALSVTPATGYWKQGEYVLGVIVSPAGGSFIDHGQTLATLIIA